MKVAASMLVGAIACASSALCIAAENRRACRRSRRTSSGRFPNSAIPKTAQIDLSRFLATPRRFMPIPLVVTEPAVGYGGGLAAMFLRPRKAAGSEGFARPNMSIVAGIATENGTWAAFAGDSSHWFDDRVQSLAGGGTGEINLDFYGLGRRQRFARRAGQLFARLQPGAVAGLVEGEGRNHPGPSACDTSIRRSSRSCATNRSFPGSPIRST